MQDGFNASSCDGNDFLNIFNANIGPSLIKSSMILMFKSVTASRGLSRMGCVFDA